jgi:hypothetical protein|tara:strand:+ start:1220 stop:1618 length:399 start_codon:yes stop_codon:yes gene_type:complete
MRATEFITETKYGAAVDIPANSKKLPNSQASAIKGAISMPDLSQNKQGGSPYTQWRFSIAMAGAPEFPTDAAGIFAGDPLLACYTEEELEIINYAARQVGAGEVRKLTDNRSTEADWVYKESPVKGFKGYPR